MLSSFLLHLHTQLHLLFFFFNDTATTEIYTLSLHDALPISPRGRSPGSPDPPRATTGPRTARGSARPAPGQDRKSTRLNSSHSQISYAVFCLKKKKKTKYTIIELMILHIQHTRNCAYAGARK